MNETDINSCIHRAVVGESNLDAATLAIKGFSTPTMRHLFNNLMAGAAIYLEIGAWFGATCCAAACGNRQLITTIIEDFSQDFSEPGVREALMANLEAVRPKTGILNFIESDCFIVPLENLPKTDVLFYDGLHSEESQAMALPHFLPALANRFVFAVDDYNWPQVNKGTNDSIAALVKADRIAVLRRWEIGPGCSNDSVWHNGVFLMLAEKL